MDLNKKGISDPAQGEISPSSIILYHQLYSFQV